MSLRMGILGGAFAVLLASAAFAENLDAEIEEVGAQIDEQYMNWETPVRTEILSLYFRALRAQEEGDDEAAAEALAAVKERMGI